MTKYTILDALRQNEGKVVSGGELANTLGVSRTAVWKQIVSLQNEGYKIESVPNKGYRLCASEVYSAYEIKRRLTANAIGQTVVFLDEVDSTNTYAKNLGASGGENGTVVVAARQTAGKGRLARKFESPEGTGVYLSILLRPQLQVSDINCITLMSAVVVADTVEELCGVRPAIKWTNDVYLNGKKLCGILTECSIEGESGAVEYAVVGIGTNLGQVSSDFPEGIRKIATSVFQETGVQIERADYAAALLNNFERYFYGQKFPENKALFLEQYRKDLLFLGQQVTVIGMTEQYDAVALDIDGEGRLLVQTANGQIKALNSGEISVRMKE